MIVDATTTHVDSSPALPFPVAYGSNAYTNPNEIQYFGLIDGELGVMSKVDPLGPRASQDAWRVADTPSGTDLEQDLLRRHTKRERGGTKAERAATAAPRAFTNAAPGVVKREGGNVVSSSLDINATNNGHGSRISTRNRQERLFTAQKPPVTKPVEGPEPPAWSRSRCGLLWEPSDGGKESSIVSLLSVSTGQGGSTTVSEGESANIQGLNTHRCSTTSCGGGMLGCNCEQQDEGENESTSFALSFVSAPWSPRDEDCSDTWGSLPSSSLWANMATTTPKQSVPAKARCRRREKGRTHARGGGDDKHNATEKAKSISRVDASPPDGRGEQTTQQPLDNGVRICKPQPELYAAWIPQHFFQGKALPTPKRMREGLEVQPQPLSGTPAQATADNKSGGRTARIVAATPNQSSDPVLGGRHHPARHQQQHKLLPAVNKRCTVHYVSGPEGFVKDDATPPPPASTRVEVPGTGTTSARATFSGRPNVSFAEEGIGGDARDTAGETDVANLEDGHSDFGLISQKSRRGDGDDDDQGGTAGGFWYDDARDGQPPLASDATAVIVEGNKSTFGWQEEEQEEEGERENEEDDDEYFDYAKRFSWQTATEVMQEAEVEAEARPIERRQHLRADGDQDQHSVEASGPLVWRRGRHVRLLSGSRTFLLTGPPLRTVQLSPSIPPPKHTVGFLRFAGITFIRAS